MSDHLRAEAAAAALTMAIERRRPRGRGGGGAGQLLHHMIVACNTPAKPIVSCSALTGSNAA